MYGRPAPPVGRSPEAPMTEHASTDDSLDDTQSYQWLKLVKLLLAIVASLLTILELLGVL
jgi:hypothetical protein